MFFLFKRDFKGTRKEGDKVYGFRDRRQMGMDSGREVECQLESEGGHVSLGERRKGQ